MDKKEALKRLETIEKEAAKPKKIVNGKLLFDGHKNYVLIDEDGEPFLLAETRPGMWGWMSFVNCVQAWSTYDSGEEAVEDGIETGMEVCEFTGCIPAIEFFLEKRREYEGE